MFDETGERGRPRRALLSPVSLSLFFPASQVRLRPPVPSSIYVRLSEQRFSHLSSSVAIGSERRTARRWPERERQPMGYNNNKIQQSRTIQAVAFYQAEREGTNQPNVDRQFIFSSGRSR